MLGDGGVGMTAEKGMLGLKMKGCRKPREGPPASIAESPPSRGDFPRTLAKQIMSFIVQPTLLAKEQQLERAPKERILKERQNRSITKFFTAAWV